MSIFRTLTLFSLDICLYQLTRFTVSNKEMKVTPLADCGVAESVLSESGLAQYSVLIYQHGWKVLQPFSTYLNLTLSPCEIIF